MITAGLAKTIPRRDCAPVRPGALVTFVHVDARLYATFVPAPGDEDGGSFHDIDRDITRQLNQAPALVLCTWPATLLLVQNKLRWVWPGDEHLLVTHGL